MQAQQNNKRRQLAGGLRGGGLKMCLTMGEGDYLLALALLSGTGLVSIRCINDLAGQTVMENKCQI